MNDANNVSPPCKPDITEEMLSRWQTIVDLMARIVGVPAGLIMKLDPPQIEVLVASATEGNPFKQGERADLNTGLYCEAVMAQRSPLLVPDALKDPDWDHNPDIELGMISYLGFPLQWPDGEIFGTICVLDSKENQYSKTYVDLMSQFKELVEAHLGLLYAREHLQDLVEERTAELKETKEQLQQNLAETEEAKQSLQERVRFERVISRLSAVSINLPHDQIDRKIDDGLHLVGEALNIDRIVFHELSEDSQFLRITHFFLKPGVQLPASTHTSEVQPWFTKTLLGGEIIKLDRIDNLPDEAKLEKNFLLKQGVKSGLAIPLIVGKKPVGVLAFTTVFRERSWPDEVVKQLQLVSEVFASALDRKHKEQKLRKSFAEIEKQLQFEKLISGLSAEFINLHPDQIDQEIDAGLKLISEQLGIDRIALLQFSEDKTELHLTHTHALNQQQRAPLFLVSEQLPWFSESLRRGKTLRISRIGEMPEEAVPEKQYAKEQGMKSFLTIPMKVAGLTIGAISYSDMKSERTWPDEIVQRLTLVSEVFGNALDRKQKEQKLGNAFSEIKELKDRLEQENIYLQEEIRMSQGHEKILGQSDAILKVLGQAEQVAQTGSSVLILGETGTGKELLAHMIHELSSRKNRQMIKVNCAALPATLIESELFGREKGAYTGAMTRQMGRFELAHGSTIFLDEVSELSPELQAKLLRVLQEGQFERLGSSKTITVDVRVIAAANQDVARLVKEHKFREDLYYRVNVFPITMPPLRERLKDIPLLVWAFIREFEGTIGKSIDSIPKKSMDALRAHSWPGNIRELRNVIERAMILCTGSTLSIDRLETEEPTTIKDMTMEELERKHVLDVLERTRWRVRGRKGAAEILGLKPSTLESRMNKLKISRPR